MVQNTRLILLTNLNPDVEATIFKSLWKFVFKINNDDCNINRDVNYRALYVLYMRRSYVWDKMIETEKDYFSSISSEPSIITYLFNFMSRQPHVFKLLSDAAKIPVLTLVDKDNDCFATAWFLDGNPQERLDKILERAESDTSFNLASASFKSIWEMAESMGFRSQAIDIAITLYIKAPSFDDADSRFSVFLQPYLKYFDVDQLRLLMEGIEKNNQCYARRGARLDHMKIMDCCENIDIDFDYSLYTHFLKLSNLRINQHSNVPF